MQLRWILDLCAITSAGQRVREVTSPSHDSAQTDAWGEVLNAVGQGSGCTVIREDLRERAAHVRRITAVRQADTVL